MMLANSQSSIRTKRPRLKSHDKDELAQKKSPKNEDNKLFFSKYFTKEKANHPITSLILKTEKSNPFVKI